MGDRPDLSGFVDEAKAGAEWALAALYRQLQPPLLGFLRGLVPQEAEDLAAETWIDAAGALPGFEGDGDAFRSLLFTIGRRRAIDYGRKRRRRRTEPTDLEELAALPSGESVDAGELLADLDSSQQAIRRIFALLPRAQAEVIVLRVVGALSVGEVAEIVGRSPAAVSVLQSRGLQRLAARIGNRSWWGWETGTGGKKVQDPRALGRWDE